MKALVLILAAALAMPALAQRGERGPRDSGGKRAGMSQDERERMREDMRDVYGGRGGERFDRARPAERPRQMTPQDREKLRRDIQDANRDLRR